METIDKGIKSNTKLKTGIDGLDKIFYGGIHFEDDNQKSLLILARGKHGVNKVHLAMQMCEGLYYDMRLRLKEIKQSQDSEYKPLKRRDSDSEQQNKLFNDVREEINNYVISIIRDNLRDLNVCDFSDMKKLSNDSNDEFLNGITKIFQNEIINQEGRTIEEYVKYKIDKIIQEYIQDRHNENTEKIKNEYKLNVYPILCDYVKKNCKPPHNEIIFISLNKDVGRLRETYFDYYIQRLIRNVQTYDIHWNDDLLKLNDIFEYNGSSDTLAKELRDGYLYYNARTHGLHKRCQYEEQKEDKDTIIWKLDLNKYEDNFLIRFIGRDELNENNENADGLTSFLNVLNKIDHINNNGSYVSCIMIDGLSCLTDEEIEHCPFSALAKSLREKSKISVLTADDRLLASKLNTDIIIDMAMNDVENPSHTYNALKISKCLYQRNAYGWHKYKMRNIGIEVFPSLKLQMSIPFFVDDSFVSTITDANRIPYKDWLDYNPTFYSQRDNNGGAESVKKIHNWTCPYCQYKRANDFESIKRGNLSLICNEMLQEKIKEVLEKNEQIPHHVLYVSIDRDRIDLYHDIVKKDRLEREQSWSKIHFLNFHPGYIYADEFLFVMDQHVKTIVGMIKDEINIEYPIEMLYKNVHLFIGDINYINIEYPCLCMDNMFIPAIADYTKKHIMENFIYTSVDLFLMASNNKTIVLEKEKELYRQIQMLTSN